MTQRAINFVYGETANHTTDGKQPNSSQVVGHHNGVSKQARLVTSRRCKTNDNATGMVCTKQSAGDHRHNHLRQSRIKIVSLNDNRRTGFCSP